MHLLGRKKELHIYAHDKLKSIIEDQLKASNTELNYPLFFHPISEENDIVIFEDDTISVQSIKLDHRISCSGFIFREIKFLRRIKANIVEQMQIPHDKLNAIKNGADWINSNGEIVKNDTMTIPNTLSNSYAFCTDTRYDESIISSIKNVDLLYHEATFMHDMLERAYETGHSTASQAALIAKKGTVNQLMLGHFSQRYKNLDALLCEAKFIFPKTILAETGVTIDFNEITS